MEDDVQHEREVRAARNQSLFRSVNEKLKDLNDAFTVVTETFVIACECADRNCTEMITIRPGEYEAVRANPRHFAVLPAHVVRDVETVVSQADEYVVVEKLAVAGETAESLDRRTE